MRTDAQSFDLVMRQLDSVVRHLDQHSSRKDLAEGCRQAMHELNRLQERNSAYHAINESQESKTQKMRQQCTEHLTKIYMWMCGQGYSKEEFLFVLDQPIDLLIARHTAALKSEIPISKLKPDATVGDSLAFIESILKQDELVENQVQIALMTTRYQLDLLITKTLNR